MDIGWEDIEKAIRKALELCPEMGRPHNEYVHLWDIVYYLDLPLEKNVILSLLDLLRTKYWNKIRYQVGFDRHLSPEFEEWGWHLQYVRAGLHNKSLKGIWRVIRFFRQHRIPCPLIGIREGTKLQ